MKHTILYILSLCLLASCQQAEEPQAVAGTGYLSIASIEVSGTDVVPVKSRAVDSDLAIEIEKADGTAVVSYDAGAAEASAKIELDAGDYVLKAHTANYRQTWDATTKGDAVYYAEQPFTIVAEKVNYLSLSVPMTNVGVHLTMPEGIGQWFKNCSLVATIGDRSVTLQDGETAYYPLPDSAVPIELTYTLSATNTDDESVTQAGCYSGVTAGTVYEITYSFASRSFVLQ